MSSRPTVPARAHRADRPHRRLAAAGVCAVLLAPLGATPVVATPQAPERSGAAARPAEGPLALGIGRQKSSSTMLRHYLSWARAYGFRVSEHPSYGGVTRGAHSKNSWHYDGLAADLNYGPAGAPSSERTRARTAIKVADSMGLGVIYARDGTVGSAASHRNHVHVDVGTTSNYGRGTVLAPAGSRTTQRLQQVAHFPLAQRDNLWGPSTDQRLQAIRAASRMHGTKFPYGVKTAQRAVGVTADGKWGPKSRAAHDKAVAALQRVVGVSATGTWGPATESKYLSVRKKLR
ncbi:peptidoglycan-binding protein [Isoptericola sp. NPDC056605]|uniref:peptidoglycan-binding domain-containing protein n=1 Tax=unclassified Isoptericola TaxID=2623355 RepID=UPI0036ABC58A